MDAIESGSTDSGHDGLRRDFVRRDVLLLSPARRTPAAQPPARSSRRPLSQEEGASASWPPCVQQAEARKEAARFILAYCLASMRAASRGKEGSGGERAIERRQRKEAARRSPTMAAVERVGPLPDPCVRASKQGKAEGTASRFTPVNE